MPVRMEYRQASRDFDAVFVDPHVIDCPPHAVRELWHA
jgi:hypothetical protein